MKNTALVVFLMLLVCGQASAATITVSPEQSSVLFRVNHDLGYNVGYFKDFSATLELGDDPAKILNAQIQVITASINTRNAVRDEGLKSALFLDAGQFPQATFESAKIEDGQITGTLTLKGVARPMVFKVERIDGKVLLKGTINRNDFGITYNKLMVDKRKSIGDAVDLIIELKVS